MRTAMSKLMRTTCALLFVLAMTFVTGVVAGEITDDTPVYYSGGKRGHIEGCRRLTEKKPEHLTTHAKMKEKGGVLCSRCPGSDLNKEREGGKEPPKASVEAPKASETGTAGNDGKFSDDTPVMYNGGKRGHIKGCRRAKNFKANTTYGEMRKKGGLLCSRCPGSATPGKGNPGGGKKDGDKKDDGKKDDGYGKYGRKGAKARKAWLKIPEKHYDPDTKAVCDALWMRVHEENCPALLLKDKKKVITLEEADKGGWRIGESGQSGRSRCCFQGYRREYPEKEFSEDTPGIAHYMKEGTRLKWHQAGCHRFVVKPGHFPMTQKEAKEYAESKNLELFYVCTHCIERGPNLTTVDLDALKTWPVPPEFTAPEGWTPKPFSIDGSPSQKEIDLLVQQTLATDYGILEEPYKDPMASLEKFMGMRFFFPVGQWLSYYQAYRATGDKRLLEALRASARYYHKRCVEYLDVAQLKAKDPEGMAFMYSMAVSARITLQLERKYPDKVSDKEVAEAEAFLKAIVSTLKPICEGDDDLDPTMGIPKPLADDFRRRAFNRASNGIGTIATATAALEDLQKLKNTTDYQPTIDRYRKCVQEWYKNWKKVGCLYTEADGKSYFYYPYNDGGRTKKDKNGLMTGGADDVGHYSHSMQGVMLVYEATPELGADDEFMTAIANAVYHNSGTKNGSIQCPSADKVKPMSRHPWSPGPRARFFMFEAFRDGLIDAQCQRLSKSKKDATLSEYSQRLKVLHAQYMKALRKDRALIHLGEAK